METIPGGKVGDKEGSKTTYGEEVSTYLESAQWPLVQPVYIKTNQPEASHKFLPTDTHVRVKPGLDIVECVRELQGVLSIAPRSAFVSHSRQPLARL